MPYADRNDPQVRQKIEERYAAKRKWQRHEDGLFHCSDQHAGCTYTHARAASVGRHTVVHTGKPYAKNTKQEMAKAAAKTPNPAQRKRDYAREYYTRYRAKQKAAQEAPNQGMPTKKETTSHVNGTHPHPEIEHTRYLLAGGFIREIQSAARALNCPEGELTSGIIQILRATTVR